MPGIYSDEDFARYQAAYEIDRKAFDREMAFHVAITIGFALIFVATIIAGTFYALTVIPEMIKILVNK